MSRKTKRKKYRMAWVNRFTGEICNFLSERASKTSYSFPSDGEIIQAELVDASLKIGDCAYK